MSNKQQSTYDCYHNIDIYYKKKITNKIQKKYFNAMESVSIPYRVTSFENTN